MIIFLQIKNQQKTSFFLQKKISALYYKKVYNKYILRKIKKK